MTSKLTREQYNSQRKDRTRAALLAAGITIARKYGLREVKREAVALEAECAPATVNFHFETIASLQQQVIVEIRRTLDTNDRKSMRVLAEAIVGGWQASRDIAEPLRSQALASFK